MVALDEWSERLYRARLDRKPIDPLTDVDPTLTVADAYQIQSGLVERLCSDGSTIVGYKLGLTSRAMQQMIGVDEPDFGAVLSSGVFTDGSDIALDEFIQPKVEAEIGLVLDQPLAGPGVTREQAAAAIGAAVAAIEMVDSRITDWRINLVDTVADLASSAAIILGTERAPIDADLRLVGMVVSRNGELEATGAGAAALGDPIGAVAWLANVLADYDVVLEPGQVVMTGALHRAFEVEPGDQVVAEFDRIGSVTAQFC